MSVLRAGLELLAENQLHDAPILILRFEKMDFAHERSALTVQHLEKMAAMAQVPCSGIDLPVQNHRVVLEMGHKQRDMAPHQFASQVAEEPFGRLAAIEYHAAGIQRQGGNLFFDRCRCGNGMLNWEHLSAFSFAKQKHQDLLIKP